MKVFFTFFLSILTCFFLKAQELDVNITINTPKLQVADPKVFENLRASLTEFFVNTKWTEDFYETEERIKVTINITITEERSIRDFRADLALQATRPIYGSDQETIIFNHQDKDFFFTYEQFQPIQYTPNTFNDNLTSVLAFYANVILALDSDSFAPFGGEKYLQTAQEILNLVPQNVARSNPGWRSVESNRNRYWLIENMLTPRVQPMRQAWYDYHRLGLDQMHKDPAVARVILLQALEDIGNVDKNYPNSMIMQSFANAKWREIVQIFNGGTPEEKNKAADIMSAVDPSNALNYRALRS